MTTSLNCFPVLPVDEVGGASDVAVDVDGTDPECSDIPQSQEKPSSLFTAPSHLKEDKDAQAVKMTQPKDKQNHCRKCPLKSDCNCIPASLCFPQKNSELPNFDSGVIVTSQILEADIIEKVWKQDGQLINYVMEFLKKKVGFGIISLFTIIWYSSSTCSTVSQ
jgi:radical SAM protein with 4Fe4S-binding SPASM domain